MKSEMHVTAREHDREVSTETILAPAHTAEPVKVPLREILADVVKKTDGDTAKGAEMLLKRLRKQHAEFYKETARNVMLYWAQSQIRNARTALRSRIASSPAGQMSTPNQALSQDSMKASAASWFEWPVLPGVPLGEATQVDLFTAAASNERNGSTLMKRATSEPSVRWLSSSACLTSQESKDGRHALVTRSQYASSFSRSFRSREDQPAYDVHFDRVFRERPSCR